MQGGRLSERGMRRSRQEGAGGSRPTTSGDDVSQSQELPASWQFLLASMRRSRQDPPSRGKVSSPGDGSANQSVNQSLNQSHDRASPQALQGSMRKSRQDMPALSPWRPTSSQEGQASQGTVPSGSLTTSRDLPASTKTPLADPMPPGENEPDLSQEQLDKQLLPAGMSMSSSENGLLGSRSPQQQLPQPDAPSRLKSPKSVMASVKGSIGLQPSNRIQPLP